ncbi:hypothetical protein PLEOSDRAFT_161862 [Pleurotus ostreatus PC15]|uniref:Uncharacterized protein n=1 Tax=Pleurotus ostreatus (strain PC15) TaxID=1137138 RepID=A0A067N7Z6_PLEO1|nr:hypothetical protein PLEOSDRAFT_161862 [Pleurotus ostreatus PC15]
MRGTGTRTCPLFFNFNFNCHGPDIIIVNKYEPLIQLQVDIDKHLNATHSRSALRAISMIWTMSMYSGWRSSNAHAHALPSHNPLPPQVHSPSHRAHPFPFARPASQGDGANFLPPPRPPLRDVRVHSYFVQRQRAFENLELSGRMVDAIAKDKSLLGWKSGYRESEDCRAPTHSGLRGLDWRSPNLRIEGRAQRDIRPAPSDPAG